MEDIRKSFSNMKKDFKHRLRGKRRAPDRSGADTAGERVSSSASLLQPSSRVAASGLNEEGTGISAGISQARSRDPSLMPVHEGRHGDSQRKEAGVDEKEGGQGDSRSGPDVEVAAGSGPSREDKRAYSPLPITSVPRKQEPEGTWTLSPRSMCLIIPLHDADASAVPDHARKELLLDENTESNAATDGKKSNWKSTTYATAKLLLRGVRDSADAFGPLKSVAGGLCFILENCEVRPSLHVRRQYSNRYPADEGERANDRVAGTQGEGTRRITPFTGFRRRRQGEIEENVLGTVRSPFPNSRAGSHGRLTENWKIFAEAWLRLGNRERPRDSSTMSRMQTNLGVWLKMFVT